MIKQIPEIDMEMHDLIGGNTKYIEAYLNLYNEMLPQYGRYIPVMRQRAEAPIDKNAVERWHQWLVMIHGKPAGMIGVIYNRKRNTGILMDFAIKPEARAIQYQEHTRLAGLILHMAKLQLIEDAREIGNDTPLYMLAEVEHKALVKKYGDYGYHEFPIDYYEPPYTMELAKTAKNIENLDKIGYQQLHLGAFDIPGSTFNPDSQQAIVLALQTLMEDHYLLPVDHWLIKKMMQQVIPA